MKNTIIFEGERTAMSASGNTEWFEFTITTTRQITKSSARSIGQIHGMGGQEFSCEEDQQDGLHIYKCKATCYCD
jgi:hypothetical protein